jgi:hypothetical protein
MRISLALIALYLSTASVAQALDSARSADKCFEDAALRWRVSPKVLMAIAKLESGGFHNVPEADDDSGHNHQKSYGVMGLRDDEVLGHSLREASAISGIPLNDVIHDPCANISAAAALLGSELARNGNNLPAALKRYWNTDENANALELLTDFQAVVLDKSFDSLNVRIAPGSAFTLGGATAGWCWRFWSGCEQQQPGPQEPQKPRKDSPAQDDDLSMDLNPPTGTGGEFPGSDFQESKNFKAGGIQQLYVVLHTTEGGFNGAVSWLTNPKSNVSAHYIIRKKDGYVKQLVRERNRAYHARCWNQVAFGIEMEGYHNDPGSFTAALTRSASNLVRYLTRKYRIAPNATRIVGHDAEMRDMLGGTGLEGCNNHKDPGEFFNWKRFWGLLAVGF